MRLIDADRLKDILEYGILCNVPADAVNTKEEMWNDWVQEAVNNAPTVEAIPKVQYEARLKADMVAMLTEIQMEIEEMTDTVVDPRTITITSWKGMQKKICDLIQQKIDNLKEVSE